MSRYVSMQFLDRIKSFDFVLNVLVTVVKVRAANHDRRPLDTGRVQEAIEAFISLVAVMFRFEAIAVGGRIPRWWWLTIFPSEQIEMRPTHEPDWISRISMIMIC